MTRHKLPQYVQAFHDRHGKQRLYFRRPGYPRSPLTGPLFSEAFWIAYHKAMAGTPNRPSAGEAKTIKGSINDLIVQYYQSLKFIQKAEATKRNYKSVIEPFRAEHGDGPVADMRPKDIEAILAKVAARSTSSAYNLRKRLHMLMAFAIKRGFRTDNPMLLVDKVEHETKGYEHWEEDDIAKFRAHWKIGTTQRLAFEILLHTGLRVSDAVRLGPQHLKKGVHTIVVQKTKKEVGIPLHVDLVPVLDAITDRHLTYLATRQGRSRSSKAFTNYVIDAAKDAGLPPHRSAHGLRKAICIRLAEAGCDALRIMAITGHQNLAEVQTYIAGVNKLKLAHEAIESLPKMAG
jgi:integrase